MFSTNISDKTHIRNLWLLSRLLYIYEERMDDITVQTHWVAVGWIVLYLPVVEAETSSQTFHLTESPPLVAKISGHKNNLSGSLKSLMDPDKTAQERTRFIL